MATEVGGALETPDCGCGLFLIEKCLYMPSDKSVLLLFMTGWLVHLFALSLSSCLHTPGKAEEGAGKLERGTCMPRMARSASSRQGAGSRVAWVKKRLETVRRGHGAILVVSKDEIQKWPNITI